MALEQNLDSIGHLTAFERLESQRVKQAGILLQTKIDGELSIGKVPPKRERSLRRSISTLQARLERFDTTVRLWNVVILVTCIEAYLQDVLAAAACVDPELMKKSEQTAHYADVVSATSLDELAHEMRRRWARAWLSDGGPRRWISRLESMGARDYAVELAPDLDLIWGIRHVTVHAAGVATADFLKRHPGAVAAVGDRVRVKSGQFAAFLLAAQAFLERTERYFLARYPSLAVSIPSKPET